MKRIVYLFIAIVILLGIGHDLRGATLVITDEHERTVDVQSNESDSENALPDLPYQEVIIEPGQTVISITEHLHNEPLTISIDQVLSDFRSLNNDINPNELQIGKSYLFPLYNL